MKRWQNNPYMVGLLLIEAIIMLYAVPKANADEISMKISLGIALFLAILVSLALLVKGNQGNYKREFGIRNTIKKLNRQLEKAADSFGNIADI